MTLEQQILDKTKKAVDIMATDFHSQITLAWPVDTGFSRRQWKLDLSGPGAKVSNPVDYTSYLWYGSSNQMISGGTPVLYGSIYKFKEIYESL